MLSTACHFSTCAADQLQTHLEVLDRFSTFAEAAAEGEATKIWQ